MGEAGRSRARKKQAEATREVEGSIDRDDEVVRGPLWAPLAWLGRDVWASVPDGYFDGRDAESGSVGGSLADGVAGRAPRPAAPELGEAPSRGLDASLRGQFESSFGESFADVRLIPSSPEVARRGAQAITVGRTIGFAPGRYRPGTRGGQRLIAHELAHTVQQSRGVTRAQAKGGERDALEDEADEAAQAALDGRAVGSLSAAPAGQPQHQDPVVDPDIDTSDVEGELDLYELELDDEDVRLLAHYYPAGITIAPARLNVSFESSNRANLFRLDGFRVQPVGPVAPGVESYIFAMGKGRSILISSPGGPSVLLDAGGGVRRSGNTRQGRRLYTAISRTLSLGLARAPTWIGVSHGDTDHYNVVNRLLADSRFSETDIRVSRQQVRGALGQETWRAMDLRLGPNQNVLEVNVTGGEAISRTYHGNFQLVEFRSVQAHAQMESTTRSTYDRNATSPVTIEIDNLTGGRKVYTADGTGRAFGQMIDLVGEQAFRRMLGGGGRNLQALEVPHHAGAVNAPEVAGFLRFLRLAFEASDGNLRLVTQTSQRFSGSPSASINFLESSGMPVERVVEPTTPEGGRSTVVRSRGADLQHLELDASRLRRVQEIARANEGPIMDGYRRLHEIKTLAEQHRPTVEALQESGRFPAMRTSLTTIAEGLATQQRALETRLNAFWSGMLADATTEGMRRDTPRPNTTAAETALRTHLEQSRSRVDELRASSQAHVDGMNAYERMFRNVLRMAEALQNNRIQDLRQLRANHGALMDQARRFLGGQEVAQHVRAAWAEVATEYTPERVRRLTARLGEMATLQRMRADAEQRAGASVGLRMQQIQRQAQLNALMERAAHGGRTHYRNGQPVTLGRTRAGAGFMALIEVARIALESYATYTEAQEQAEIRRGREALEGLQTVTYWGRLGATPRLKLVARSAWSGRFNVIDEPMTQTDIWAIVNDEYTGEAPEYDKVVVDNVPDEELETIVNRLNLEVNTLADFLRWNGRNPSGPTFRKFDDGDWGVRLWSAEDQGYRYFSKRVIQSGLNALYPELEANQRRSMEAMIRDDDDPVQTVDDTAWVGNDRYVYVFTRGGNMERIDFGATQPRFVRWGTVNIGRDTWAKVKAADLRTYRRLSQHYWRRQTGTYMGANSSGFTYSVFRNADGFGLVDPDDLTTTVGTSVYETTVRARPMPEVSETDD